MFNVIERELRLASSIIIIIRFYLFSRKISDVFFSEQKTKGLLNLRWTRKYKSYYRQVIEYLERKSSRASITDFFLKNAFTTGSFSLNLFAIWDSRNLQNRNSVNKLACVPGSSAKEWEDNSAAYRKNIGEDRRQTQ